MRPQGNALQGPPLDGSWLCKMDPWKALEVSWDAADTPASVPVRVSPWEVCTQPQPVPKTYLSSREALAWHWSAP